MNNQMQFKQNSYSKKQNKNNNHGENKCFQSVIYTVNVGAHRMQPGMHFI